MITLLKKSLSAITYSSLCIPEDIAERGMEAVPNFYYRDDGLRLWDIIHWYYKSFHFALCSAFKNHGCHVVAMINSIKVVFRIRTVRGYLTAEILR